MSEIAVVVFDHEAEIGTAMLACWDDGMAVAGGDFMPNDRYSPSLHATILDGLRPEREPGISLQVQLASGEPIACSLVAISDHTETVGFDAREVEVHGLDLPRYFQTRT